MSLLNALKLKPTPAMLAARAGKAAKAGPTRAGSAGRAAAAPEAVPARRIVAMPVAAPIAPAAAPELARVGQPVAAVAPAAPEAAQAKSKFPRADEIGWGDTSVTFKDIEGGLSVSMKYEQKLPGPATNFVVWVIPCYVKVDLKAAIEGGGEFTESSTKVSIAAKAGGVLELGVGGTSPLVTAGPYGAAELVAQRSANLTFGSGGQFSIEAGVIDVFAVGKVGIKIEIKDGPVLNSEAELANWHVLVIHAGAYTNGQWQPFSVSAGRDMQRLIAAVQQIGPAVADAVEKHAPEAVKKAAVDAAKWVAESDEAKGIADATEVVLDKIEEKTGVDIAGGAESIVRDLVDPGGETADETTARIEKEMAAANDEHAKFRAAMQASGLDTELRPPYRTVDEYNAIVDAHAADPEGPWRDMVVALVQKAREKKRLMEAAAKAKQKQELDATAAAAKADLDRRVREAEAQMAAALTAALNYGNPLNNSPKAQPGTQARKYWESGMMKFYNKGVNAKNQVGSLQGEARIAKAREAAQLFSNAAQVFQEGMRVLG
jgi:hypothetical protein